MRSSKPQQNTPNLKLMTFIFCLFLIIVFLKLGHFSSTLQNLQYNIAAASTSYNKLIQFNKIPSPLANALVHYATSNYTPQQTLPEISVTLRVLEKKSPCNLLVFGLGNDSLMWSSLNYGGRTVFLEEDEKWMEISKRDLPSMEAYHVVYNTRVSQATELIHVGKDEDCKIAEDPRLSKCRLSIKNFPNEVYETEWDLIMVDAPTGFRPELPGRMSAIYTAGLMARNRKQGETDVFVHDVDRWVEDKFSMVFLCEGYWKEQVGRLRHFTIPTHFGHSNWPFCP